jgi:hypothetical protein
VLPADLLQGISGIISGLDSSMAQRSVAAAAAAAAAAVAATAPAPAAAAPIDGQTALAASGAGEPALAGANPSLVNSAGGNSKAAGGNPALGGGPGGGGGGRPNPNGPGQTPVDGPYGQAMDTAGRRRRLLSNFSDTVRQRADVTFIGFLFMTLLDLALLVLFGLQHPHSKERSPRVYISGVDHQQQQQISLKNSSVEGVALQVRQLPDCTKRFLHVNAAGCYGTGFTCK